MAAWCKTRVVLHAGQPSESEHWFHASVSKDVTLRFGLAGLALCLLPQYERLSDIVDTPQNMRSTLGSFAQLGCGKAGEYMFSLCQSSSLNNCPGFGGPEPAQKRIHTALVRIRSLCRLGGCKDHPDRYGFCPMVAMVKEDILECPQMIMHVAQKG